jgi:F0F1-type ATP synthase membrane subunit a
MCLVLSICCVVAGWTAIFAAMIVIILGTSMLPQPSDQLAFQITYALVILSLVGTISFMKKDKGKYINEESKEKKDEYGEDIDLE